MAFFLRFPKVAANIDEGMVGVWHKREGDAVARDEAVVELVTDKATFDVPADEGGTLLRICAPEKSTVPVGYVLAVIGAPDEAAPDPTAENERLMAEHRRRAAADWQQDAGAARAARTAVRATPSARRLARQHGVDLADVEPGRGGIVRDEDVLRCVNDKGSGQGGKP